MNAPPRASAGWFERLFPAEAPEGLGDFTATRRMIPICGIALCVGVVSGLVAKLLLSLIGLFTNLFIFQRVELGLVSPAHHTLGPSSCWCRWRAGC